MKTRCVRVLTTLAVFLSGLVVGRFFIDGNAAVWAGGMAPCKAGDTNGDGDNDVSDVVYLLSYLFAGGPPPASCSTGAGPVSTVILVRHAERDGAPDNCPDTCPSACINADGRARAERLAEVLADLDVDNLHLIASELCRTTETLEPTSIALGVPIEEIAEPEEVAKRVFGLPQGATSVVAHHSFTLHSILEELGLDDVRDIPVGGSNYDNLFVVMLPDGGNAQLLRLHY